MREQTSKMKDQPGVGGPTFGAFLLLRLRWNISTYL